MNIIRKILGPKSKYDSTIPYTYKAEINVLQGVEADPLFIQNDYQEYLPKII